MLMPKKKKQCHNHPCERVFVEDGVYCAICKDQLETAGRRGAIPPENRPRGRDKGIRAPRREVSEV